MEVTQIAHQNTHAIVGGGKAESFGINANAEFYEMLSSTLYPNKKLAAVREVLCNAWDAHLMVDRPDLPVQVTLNAKELIIRDFGPGISPEKIMAIYCTYGGSTKSHDGKQTGGFGLGSKAPFAYTKHFTVVSCHAGERMIYAASRGSAETEGRPDFRPMLLKGLPTDETGITVTIPIKSEGDMREFETLVKELSYAGGILCELNGTLLERIDYDKAEMPFMLVDTHKVGRHHESSTGLFVRYGAVVYPVSLRDPAMESMLKDHGGALRALVQSYAVILLAEPNSIGVAPSRETLSYTDKTIATIRGLVGQSEEAIMSIAGTAQNMAIRIMTNLVIKAELPITSMESLAVASNNDGKVPYQTQILSRYSYRSYFTVGNRGLTKKGIAQALADKIVSSVSSYNRPTDIIPEDFDTRLGKIVIGRLYRKYPHLKRSFNQIRATRRRHRHHSKEVVSGNATIRHDAERHWSRLCARIENEFGIKLSFASVERRYGSEYNCQEKPDLPDLNLLIQGRVTFKKILKSLPVVIAPTYAAIARMASNVKFGGRSVIFAKARKGMDYDKLTAMFQTFGMGQDYDAREYVKVREPIEASKTLYLLNGSEMRKQFSKKPYFTPKPIEEFVEGSAKYFIYGTLEDSGYPSHAPVSTHVTPLGSLLTPWLLETYGNIVVVHNVADVRKLEKMGLTNLMQVIADEIRAYKADDAALLEIATNLSSLIQELPNTLGCIEPKVLSGFLARLDPTLVEAVAPKVSDEMISIIGLYRGANGTKGGQYVAAAVKELTERIHERLSSARAIFEKAADREDKKASLFNTLANWHHFSYDYCPIIGRAMLFAAAEAAHLQHKLAPKAQ